MKNVFCKNFRTLLKFLLLFVFFINFSCFNNYLIKNAFSQEEAIEQQETPPVDTISNAAELAPKANELMDKYNSLLETISSFEKFLESSKEKLKKDKETFDSLKSVYLQTTESKYAQYNKLNEIGIAIKEFSQNVDNDISEYTSKITMLNDTKKEWQSIKENWQKWRSDFFREYNVIKDVFVDANKNITNALNDIEKIEKPLLVTQTEFSSFQTEIKNILRDIDTTLVDYKKDVFTKTDLSFFTKDFWQSFNFELYDYIKEDVVKTSEYFSFDFGYRYILLLIINILLAIVITFFLVKLKHKDKKRDNIERLARRPFSTSLFISTILVGFYYGQDTPNILKSILLLVVAISGARAVFCFIEKPSRKVFLNILVIAFLISKLFVIINIPEPVVRIYIAFVSFIILLLSLKYKNYKYKQEDSFIGRDALLNLVAVLTFVAFVAELFGFSKLSLKIFDSSVRSLFSGILIWLLGILFKEGFFVFLHYSWLSKFKVCKNYSYHIQRKFTLLINVLVTFLIICVVLVAWGGYDSFNKSIVNLLSLGVNIRGMEITLGKVFLALLLFQLIIFISWAIQRILDEEVYPRKRVQYGVQSSINRIIGYLSICIGVVVALSIVGFNLQNLAVVFGALGVGIGFGLQNIVNNFASGLILLFERPIKVGDVVDVGGQKGTVRKIGLRATIIELFDKTEVIVPNSEIAATKITNLTLSSRNVRSAVAVSVAYGSDIDKVIRVLLEIAQAKENILKEPNPIVIFKEFGASSLDFELLFWSIYDNVASLKNELHQEIYKKFVSEGIEIPFNQLDVNIQTLEGSIKEYLQKGGKKG
ncbi:MAG: mechanosensitive ion channel [Bdellovibrionota bacterium]|nr:mechanosensitive ion channel [Pseudomonadota bacterium]MDY6090744.1 mechanosensitive ion channel [Bdellovibrionota bacterium]